MGETEHQQLGNYIVFTSKIGGREWNEGFSMKDFYRLQMKLREGNIFTLV